MEGYNEETSSGNCICNDGYKKDENGICKSICATGQKYSDGRCLSPLYRCRWHIYVMGYEMYNGDDGGSFLCTFPTDGYAKIVYDNTDHFAIFGGISQNSRYSWTKVSKGQTVNFRDTDFYFIPSVFWN